MGCIGYSPVFKEGGGKMMTIKKIFKDEESISREIGRLKKDGYQRISNCYWYETWKKENVTIELERDF